MADGKERLDILVQRASGVSRSKAQGLIYTGHVCNARGECLFRPGMRLPEDEPLIIRATRQYVSRGGEKLQAALDAFQPRIEGRTCIDVGASTGGFTDCLLQHGAGHVIAVDVGYGQLAWELRQNPRVTVLERCNIRHLTREQLVRAPEFFTADCSFISLTKVLPPVVALFGDLPEGIALIKPQFEAGHARVGKGGVVRDPAVHDAVIASLTQCARELGFLEIDVIPSPLRGPAGNREFLAYMRGFDRPAPGVASERQEK